MEDRYKKSGKVFSNFNRKNKWRGIIDYKTIIFLAIYVFGIWNIVNIFNIRLLYQIYILIIFTIPVATMCFAYSSEESVIDILVLIIKYLFSNKEYIYILKKDKKLGLVLKDRTIYGEALLNGDYGHLKKEVLNNLEN